MAKELHITLTRSVIGQNESQRNSSSIRFKKLNQTVVKADNVAVRGMINKVSHLLTVVEK